MYWKAITIVLLLCLGCAKDEETRYISESVIFVNDEIPNLTNLSPPSSEDRALAKSLDKTITEVAFKYLYAHGYQGYNLSLIAARKIDNFFLLDISTGKPDGNVQLIYSIKSDDLVKSHAAILRPD